MEIFDLNKTTSVEFNKLISEYNTKALAKIKNLAQLFKEDFVSRFNIGEGVNSLSNVKVKFNITDNEMPNRVVRTRNGITVNLYKDASLSKSALSELKNEILDNVNGVLSNTIGFYNGVNQGFVYKALETLDEAQSKKLAGMLLQKEFLDNNADIASELAFAIYRITDGYYSDTATDIKKS